MREEPGPEREKMLRDCVTDVAGLRSNQTTAAIEALRDGLGLIEDRDDGVYLAEEVWTEMHGGDTSGAERQRRFRARERHRNVTGDVTGDGLVKGRWSSRLKWGAAGGTVKTPDAQAAEIVANNVRGSRREPYADMLARACQKVGDDCKPAPRMAMCEVCLMGALEELEWRTSELKKERPENRMLALVDAMTDALEDAGLIGGDR